jgi:acyl-CoA synthetase (AMP-forming)/AMP-acid ligase II
MLNLSVLLEDSVRKYPTRDALVLGDTRLTYAQVDAAASQVANLLVERGIRPGDKVALSCPTSASKAVSTCRSAQRGTPGSSRPPSAPSSS